MHLSTASHCGALSTNVNLFPYPPQRSRCDLPQWIPRLGQVNRLVHLHACRPGAVNANDLFLISRLRATNGEISALHGVNQPGYSVARHMAELLSGLPVGTIDDLAARMMDVIGVDANDPEQVCELLSLPASDVRVPRGGFDSVLGVGPSRGERGSDGGPSEALDKELLRVSLDAAATLEQPGSVTLHRHDFDHDQRLSSSEYAAAVLAQLQRMRRRDAHAARELAKRFGSSGQMRRSSRIRHHFDLLEAKTERAGSASLWGRRDWLGFALTEGLSSPARLLVLGVRAEEIARHRMAAGGTSLVTAADSIRAAVAVARELQVPVVVQEFMRVGEYSAYETLRAEFGDRLRQAPICAWDSDSNPDFMVGVLELVRRQGSARTVSGELGRSAVRAMSLVGAGR